MKKVLLITILLLIKLNAYEYVIYNDDTLIRIYYNKNHDIYMKRIQNNKIIEDTNNWSSFLYSLYGIKNNLNGFISKNDFDNILKKDLILLNDFLFQRIKQFLIIILIILLWIIHIIKSIMIMRFFMILTAWLLSV